MHVLSKVALGAVAMSKLTSAGYILQDDYSTESFFSMFEFFTETDPTNGYVEYVDQSTAESAGLINTDDGKVYIGVDDSTVLDSSSSGRQSVRLSSVNTYTHGLVILDLEHMPGSDCGSWPAFWTVGPDWPAAGEIDILEGVNDQTSNIMTLHTGSGCSVSDSTATSSLYAGYFVSSECTTGQNDENGCQIATTDTTTYGDGFNAAGGGVYAMEWTAEVISIYMFASDSIPDDITSGSPDPTGWGTPLASWGDSDCDLDSHFYDHQIVFDITFCGDWAGAVWSDDSTCSALASTCTDYVMSNPTAFQDAYWSINSLKVYQDDGTSSGSSSAAAATATSAVGINVSIYNSVNIALSTAIAVPVYTTQAAGTQTTAPAEVGGVTSTITETITVVHASGSTLVTTTSYTTFIASATPTAPAASSTAASDGHGDHNHGHGQNSELNAYSVDVGLKGLAAKTTSSTTAEATQTSTSIAVATSSAATDVVDVNANINVSSEGMQTTTFVQVVATSSSAEASSTEEAETETIVATETRTVMATATQTVEEAAATFEVAEVDSVTTTTAAAVDASSTTPTTTLTSISSASISAVEQAAQAAASSGDFDLASYLENLVNEAIEYGESMIPSAVAAAKEATGTGVKVYHYSTEVAGRSVRGRQRSRKNITDNHPVQHSHSGRHSSRHRRGGLHGASS